MHLILSTRNIRSFFHRYSAAVLKCPSVFPVTKFNLQSCFWLLQKSSSSTCVIPPNGSILKYNSIIAKEQLTTSDLGDILKKTLCIEGLQLVSISSELFQQVKVLKMGKTKAGGFYAVARGRSVGIYHTWDECKVQVNGFTNARYKKFPSQSEAEAFIDEHRGTGAVSGATVINKCSSSTKPKLASTSNPPKPSFVSTGITSTPGLFQSKLPNKPVAPKRDFSSLKVTEDRVTNKRAKLHTANSKVDLEKFCVEDGYVVVFTDGACSKNGRKLAKAGIGVWFGNNHHLNISEPVTGRQTNNTAEIQAAERAIRQAKEHGINKLNVKTDSQFTINCVTKWLYNWKRNNWRLSGGGDVKNKEDLIKLDDVMQNMEIKWSYVAGHAGIEGNEAADRLAVAGAERAK